VPLLVSNLTGCAPAEWRRQDSTTTRKVAATLVDSILRQSPGAKLGSTAPHAWADLAYFETGPTQPRSLANAFLEALPLQGDVRQTAVQRLAAYVSRLDLMYGAPGARESRHLATVLEAPTTLPPRQPVAKSVNAALEALWAAA
jgi:CRISPR system Cascade subunit CasC